MLDAAIRSISTGYARPSHLQWAIRAAGMRRNVNVELSDRWLSVSLSLRLLRSPTSLKIIGTMLRRNARMDGCCRIIGPCRQDRRQIVTDMAVDLLPWDSEAELGLLLSRAITGLNAALSTSRRHSKLPAPAAPPRGQAEACFVDAGWPSQPGAGECLEVPLEVPGNYFVANVDYDGASTRLCVPILPGEYGVASAASRSAVSVLLWMTASSIRMVKPVRSRRAPGLEVSLLPQHCNATGLGHACATLSVALQHCAAEAALLVADERLAQVYLSNLGFPTSS